MCSCSEEEHLKTDGVTGGEGKRYEARENNLGKDAVDELQKALKLSGNKASI